MSPVANVHSTEDAMLIEEHLHGRRMLLLADSAFNEGNRIGLEQEKQGLTVSLSELRQKYGRK
jgi:hypothetical protein